MMMSGADTAQAFMVLVRVLAAAAADAGAPHKAAELSAALDDAAAYCHAEASRAVMRERLVLAAEASGQPVEPIDPDNWVQRTSHGWYEACARLVDAVRAFEVNNNQGEETA